MQVVDQQAAALKALRACPTPALPRPKGLYGVHRTNSRGLDLSNENTLTELATTLQATATHAWTSAPLLGA